MSILLTRLFRDAGLAERILLVTLCVGMWLTASWAFAQPLPFLEAPSYPDAQIISPVYGTITYELTASGQHIVTDGDLTTTITLQVTARFSETWDKGGHSYMEKVAGRATIVLADPDRTTRMTTTWSLSDTGLTPEETVGRSLAVSPSLGATNFLIDDEFGHGRPIKWHCQTSSSDGETYSDDGEGSLHCRMPNIGLAGTPYAAAARAVEDSGMLSGHPLLLWLDHGYIEAPWDDSGTHGQFSVPGLLSSLACGDVGMWDTKPAWKAAGFDVTDETFFPGTLTVSWSLGGKPPQAEMIIEPEDGSEYEKWLPSPADDEQGTYEPSTPLLFRAKIRPKDGEDEQVAPQGRIDFWLRNVSRHKGKCTNYPTDAEEKDDLRFASDQSDLIIDPENPKHAYTRSNRVSEAMVAVEATDTGAYGTLQATCDELGLIATYEPTGAQSVTIPFDDNNNHVSDRWELDQGVNGNDATWDEDPTPAGQRRNGDGYTLYEEYRGFVTKDGFVRTSPLKKDLFVYDPDGLVKQYYEPYTPAQVELHYIDQTMMKFSGVATDPDNRWVNSNSSEETWYARQYALYVVRWTTMSGDAGGLTAGEASLLENVLRLQDDINGWSTAQGVSSFEEPLKRFYIVKIAINAIERAASGIRDPSVRQAVFNAEATSTVIHEIGHAIGIRHHQTGIPYYDPDEPEDQRPGPDQGGVFDCAMRYRVRSEYQHPELLQALTRYCRAGETWQGVVFVRDDEGNRTANTEVQVGDDCFGQIDIKSDP